MAAVTWCQAARGPNLTLTLTLALTVTLYPELEL